MTRCHFFLRHSLCLLTLFISACGPGTLISLNGFGNAISFSGTTGSYVNINYPSNTSMPAVFTLEAFVYFRSFSNSENVVYFWGPPMGGSSSLFLAVDNSGKVQGGYPSTTCTGVGIITSSSSIAVNTKYHLAVTHNGSVPVLYINGVKDSTAVISNGSTTVSCTSSHPMSIGGDNANDMANATIDEVRLSTTVRYQGAFSVPSRAFEMDGGTAILFHMDDTTLSSGSLLGLTGYSFNFLGTPSPQYVISPFP